ncbi:auxin-responsive protein IAA29-like [Telopea speciosissima]|uniref:auxin-responsive protein IAA29-like n=1 Tax=Telopea speciosissima TaxID=54955 RepID=UPI001CC6B567|nr:auxin-responsive protein IAA29-like [Telopea speciosissima]
MEIQLGLARARNPVKDLDLEKYLNNPKDEFWTHSCCSGKNKVHKRSFDETFEIVSPVTPTLPLLSWNDKPKGDDDRDGDSNRNNLEKSSSCTIHKSNGNGDEIMGWPPISRWRSRLHLLHHHHHHHQQQQNQGSRAQNDGRDAMGSRGIKSMYVKVKMEGVAIGRKVDLTLHRSYQTLTNTLVSMFEEYHLDKGDMAGSNNGKRYTLTYQDRDGNWLLVGDIPWQTFVGSVKCLKILWTGGSLACVLC